MDRRAVAREDVVDRNGEKIGKLQDVYVDVETDEPQFATVKEGFLDGHLTFVPLAGVASALTS
jgi:sporulation protein YlmC with PRC-barrel domain